MSRQLNQFPVFTGTLPDTALLHAQVLDDTSVFRDRKITFATAKTAFKGDMGATGAAGANGADAYAIAVAQGFVGSLDAWLASIKGDKGDKGDTGAPGTGFGLPASAPADNATQVTMNFIVVGDSLSVVHGIGVTTSWPLQFAAMLTPGRVNIVNTAVSGWKLADCYDDYSTHVAPYAPVTTGVPAYLSLWIGANDYFFNPNVSDYVNGTGAFAGKGLVQYLARAYADGFIILDHCIARRSDADAYEGVRQAINAIKRATMAGVSRVIDCDTLLGDTATTAPTDGVHHTDQFKLRIARRVLKCILTADPDNDPNQYVPFPSKQGSLTLCDIDGTGTLSWFASNGISYIKSGNGLNYTTYATLGGSQASGGGHNFVSYYRGLLLQLADDEALFTTPVNLFGHTLGGVSGLTLTVGGTYSAPAVSLPNMNIFVPGYGQVAFGIGIATGCAIAIDGYNSALYSERNWDNPGVTRTSLYYEPPTAVRTYVLKDPPTTVTLNMVAAFTRPTTGDDSLGYEGQVQINTTDRTVKMMCDGGWRTLATW